MVGESIKECQPNETWNPEHEYHAGLQDLTVAAVDNRADPKRTWIQPHPTTSSCAFPGQKRPATSHRAQERSLPLRPPGVASVFHHDARTGLRTAWSRAT